MSQDLLRLADAMKKVAELPTAFHNPPVIGRDLAVDVEYTIRMTARVLDAIENPKLLGRFSYGKRDDKWLAYWYEHWCLRDVSNFDDPRYFDSMFDAIAWILDHGAEYADKAAPHRFPEGLPREAEFR